MNTHLLRARLEVIVLPKVLALFLLTSNFCNKISHHNFIILLSSDININSTRFPFVLTLNGHILFLFKWSSFRLLSIICCCCLRMQCQPCLSLTPIPLSFNGIIHYWLKFVSYNLSYWTTSFLPNKLSSFSYSYLLWDYYSTVRKYISFLKNVRGIY